MARLGALFALSLVAVSSAVENCAADSETCINTAKAAHASAMLQVKTSAVTAKTPTSQKAMTTCLDHTSVKAKMIQTRSKMIQIHAGRMLEADKTPLWSINKAVEICKTAGLAGNPCEVFNKVGVCDTMAKDPDYMTPIGEVFCNIGQKAACYPLGSPSCSVEVMEGGLPKQVNGVCQPFGAQRPSLGNPYGQVVPLYACDFAEKDAPKEVPPSAVKGEAMTNECPAGSEMITSAAECKIHGATIGLKGGQDHGAVETMVTGTGQIPKGCINNMDKLYFNPDPAGAPNHHFHPVCKVSAAPVTEPPAPPATQAPVEPQPEPEPQPQPEPELEPVDLIPYSLKEAVMAGTKEIPVISNEGFAIGDKIVIDAGTPIEETNTIVGFASLILETPLKYDHGQGVLVTKVAMGSGLGSTAPLDAAGFKAVTSFCCPTEMEQFFNRLLDQMGLQVCSKPHIQGLMHWFSCVPNMDFQYVIDVINNGNPCKYWAFKGATCSALTPECYGRWCR